MPQLSNKMNAVCTVTASKFLKNIEFIMNCFDKTLWLALWRVTADEPSSEKFTKIHVPASVVALSHHRASGSPPPPSRAEQIDWLDWQPAAAWEGEAVWGWILEAALGSLGPRTRPGTVAVGALVARAVVGAASTILVSSRKILKRRNQLHFSKKPRLEGPWFTMVNDRG